MDANNARHLRTQKRKGLNFEDVQYDPSVKEDEEKSDKEESSS